MNRKKVTIIVIYSCVQALCLSLFIILVGPLGSPLRKMLDLEPWLVLFPSTCLQYSNC